MTKYAKFLGLGLMAATLGLAGCDKKAESTKAEPTKSQDKKGGHADEHAHGKGPNGGVIFDLGKYHAEFTVDHKTAEATLFVLGADEKTPTAVAAKELTLTTKATKTAAGKAVPPMTIKMTPKDAKDGKAAKFVGTDPGLDNVADFEGDVTGEINGKPAQGEFKEEEHDDHKPGKK